MLFSFFSIGVMLIKIIFFCMSNPESQGKSCAKREKRPKESDHQMTYFLAVLLLISTWNFQVSSLHSFSLSAIWLTSKFRPFKFEKKPSVFHTIRHSISTRSLKTHYHRVTIQINIIYDCKKAPNTIPSCQSKTKIDINRRKKWCGCLLTISFLNIQDNLMDWLCFA